MPWEGRLFSGRRREDGPHRIGGVRSSTCSPRCGAGRVVIRSAAFKPSLNASFPCRTSQSLECARDVNHVPGRTLTTGFCM